MTIILETPDRPTVRSFAGGEGSIADIAAASFDSLLFANNSGAAIDALERAYDDRARELHGVAGVKLDNPVRGAWSDFRMATEAYQANLQAGNFQPDREEFSTILARREAQFDAGLASAVENIPDRMVADRLMRSVEGDAVRLARESDERLARLMESRTGPGKWAALFAGGLAGSLADPITLMSLGAGAGPGAVRTVAGRIFAVAGKEAIINAATEAFAQPAVQAWREKAGLPHGFGEAMTNVAFAGLFGGVLGGAGQGVAEALSRSVARTRVARAVDELALREDAPAPLRAVLEGEPARAPDAGAAAARAAAPAARGDRRRRADRPCRRAAAGGGDAGAARPGGGRRRPGDPRRGGLAGLRAGRRAGVAGCRADRRGNRRRRPGAAHGARALPRRARRAAGPHRRAQADRRDRARRSGPRPAGNGAPRDVARGAAAGAGCLDQVYGTPDEAVAKSTVRDLYDALDAEIRDSFAAGPAGGEARFAGLEATVHDVARLAGPALPDDLLEAAARLAIGEGMEPGDALERVLTRAELAAPAVRGGPGVADEPLPGWSDAELLAASENRGGTPEPDGLDDPGKPEEGQGAAAPERPAPPATIDELYARAPERQAELEELGRTIAGETGAEFRAKGFKKRETAESKIARKGYADATSLTDVVRGGFVVATPEQADRVAAALNRRLDVLDEGWSRSMAGYVDRKLLVRFEDGTVGEVQLWEPHMLAAKEREGHALYRKARGLAPGSPEAAALQARMREIYAAASSEAGETWSALAASMSSGPNSGSNLARQASSDIAPPSWKTSQKSTGVQVSAGRSTASAASSNRTAGRRSN